MRPNQQQQRAAESKGSAASLRAYLAEIGAKGGKASRRKITPEQQAAMQAARAINQREQGGTITREAAMALELLALRSPKRARKSEND